MKMVRFPSVSISDIDLLKKTHLAIVAGDNTTAKLCRRLGLSRTNIYKIISILEALNLIKKNKTKRRNIYMPLKKKFVFSDAFLSNGFVIEVLRLIFNGMKSRKNIAKNISTQPKNVLGSISAVASIARKAGLMRNQRSYKLTPEGERQIFRLYLLDTYNKIVEKKDSKIVEIPELRKELSRYLVFSRRKFEMLLLDLEKTDTNVQLSTAPVLNDFIRKEGIKTESGIIYYFSYG
ncbi:MAG: hypothetical protein Q6363_002485 [Candidatus Njordarchaeota archaeon]